MSDHGNDIGKTARKRDRVKRFVLGRGKPGSGVDTPPSTSRTEPVSSPGTSIISADATGVPPLVDANTAANEPSPPRIADPESHAKVSAPALDGKSLSLWNAAYEQLRTDEATAKLVAEYESALATVEPKAAPLLAEGKALQRVDAMKMVVNAAGTSRYSKKLIELWEWGTVAVEVASKVLETVKADVDELAKASPVASLAWAGICVAVPHLIAPILAREAMRKGLDHVSGRLKWFMALTDVLLRDSWKEKGDFEKFKGVLEDRMTALYAKLLEFQIRAVCARASPILAAAKAMVNWDDWEGLVNGIEEEEDALNHGIEQYTNQAVKERLRSLLEVSGKMLVVLEKSLDVHLKSIDVGQLQLDAHHRAEADRMKRQREETINSFHIVDEANYDNDRVVDRVADRVEGTCLWLDENDINNGWQEWLREGQETEIDTAAAPGATGPSLSASTASASNVIVIAALPGWGKSVVSKHLVESRLNKDLGEAWTVCHFFFKFDMPGMDSAMNALRWFMWRLLDSQPDLVDQVSSKPSGVSKLIELFKNILSSKEARPVVFLLDSFDNCSKNGWDDVLRFLNTVRALHKVRIIITTRPLPDILNRFKAKLGGGDGGRDDWSRVRIIRLYKEEGVKLIQKEMPVVCERWVGELDLDDKQKEDLRKALANSLAAGDRGQRTYLWLDVLFDAFKLPRNDDIDDIIKELPGDLYAAYELLLKNEVANRDRDQLAVLLRLIMAAKRPLTLDEANVAIWSWKQHKRGKTLSLCSSEAFGKWVSQATGFFVSTDQGRLYFLHETCKEYLLREDSHGSDIADTTDNSRGGSSSKSSHHSFSMFEAHATAAECCLLLLRTRPSRPSQSAPEYEQNTNHLMAYATAYLTHHFGLSQSYEAAVAASSSLSRGDLTQDLSQMYRRFIDNLIQVEKCGLEIAEIRDIWWDTDFISSVKPEDFAKSRRLFLRQLAFPKAQWLIVLSLIPQVAPEVSPPTMETVGMLTGHLVLFRSMNQAVPPDWELPGPPIEFVRELREVHVDLPAFNRPMVPLLRAASLDCVHIVEWLVENDAKTEQADNVGNTTLHAAVSEPFALDGTGLESARVLLKAGADHSAVNESGATPLFLAAKTRQWGVVELLLQHGADPNWLDNRMEETPLMYAVDRDLTTVIALLDGGADPEQSVKGGMTALIWAVMYERLPAMRVLLERGALPNTRGYSEYVALHYAASLGTPAMVELLIDHGADVTLQDMLGRTPLHMACSYQDPPKLREICELLLLNQHANADNDEWSLTRLEDEEGRLPLHALADNAFTRHLNQWEEMRDGPRTAHTMEVCSKGSAPFSSSSQRSAAGCP